MEKINLNSLRGKWVEVDEDTGHVCAGGDDTVVSIKLLAEKVNEIISTINDTIPYYTRDHAHCWDQTSPACGRPPEIHSQCCLCMIKNNKK